MKWIYYYATQAGDAQELAFESPLQEQELIVNGYRFLRSGIRWQKEEVEG